MSRQNKAAGCAFLTSYFLIAIYHICNKLSIFNCSFLSLSNSCEGKHSCQLRNIGECSGRKIPSYRWLQYLTIHSPVYLQWKAGRCCLSSSSLFKEEGWVPGQQWAAMPGGKLPSGLPGHRSAQEGHRTTAKQTLVYHYNMHAECSIPGSSLCMDTSPKKLLN